MFVHKHFVLNPEVLTQALFHSGAGHAKDQSNFCALDRVSLPCRLMYYVPQEGMMMLAVRVETEKLPFCNFQYLLATSHVGLKYYLPRHSP